MYLADKYLRVIALVIAGGGGVIQPATAEQPGNSFDTFAIKLGGSRIIYNVGEPGASLVVINPQSYPMLVQPRMLAEDQISDAPFVVTPPLFRLDGMQQNRLRIVYTGDALPDDRETLYWLCVSALPPKGEGVTGEKSPAASRSEFRIQLQLNSCIKTMLRPAGIKGDVSSAASKLRWQIADNKLTAHNDSPFYIHFKYIHIDGEAINQPDYIAPFSSGTYSPGGNKKNKK